MRSKIEKNIMRRVYYSYLLSVFSHGMFWQGMVLGGSVAAFGRLTHVAAIIENFLAVPIGNAPKYMLEAVGNAAASGEFMTLLSIALMTGLSVSFAYHMMRTIPFMRMRVV